MRRAFTLIEMMIAISILSIMMLFLYKSYAELNLSNKTYKASAQKLQQFQTLKQVMYLDFMLAKDVKIIKRDKQHDVVFVNSMHSIHDKIQPSIAYIVKEGKLYRLESLKPFTTYPFASQHPFVVDALGEVKSFRVYQGKNAKSFFLVHSVFSNDKAILFKVKALNI